jgi:hypothetical protein
MAAVHALRRIAKAPSLAWYQGKNPRISALEKQFPTNFLVRSVICSGVLLYLFYLVRKLRRADLLDR